MPAPFLILWRLMDRDAAKIIKGIMKYKKEEEKHHCIFVHVGEKVAIEMRNKKIRKSDFAKKVGTDRRNLYRILKKNSLETDLLYRYSKELKHNFFRDLADEFDLNHSSGL